MRWSRLPSKQQIAKDKRGMVSQARPLGVKSCANRFESGRGEHTEIVQQSENRNDDEIVSSPSRTAVQLRHSVNHAGVAQLGERESAVHGTWSVGGSSPSTRNTSGSRSG